MPEFLDLMPPDQARKIFLDQVPINLKPEDVTLEQALGRVTAEPVLAPHPLPTFNRSAMDGYAVRAMDTYGAGESLASYLKLAGEVPMGGVPDFDIYPGTAALIHTGGMLPASADAVVMLEHTQLIQPSEVEVLRAVAVGENVIKAGEDVSAGQIVIERGTRMRAAEIGGLAALGIINVKVAYKPRVGILSSGDEVVPPAQSIQPGQVRDVNSNTLSALVSQAGGQPVLYGILPDRGDILYEIASRALAECDILVITAGSSASVRDLTAEVINRLGKPGVLVHGVNVRPGKPTILAVCGNKGVIGLPGNPVSALVIAGLFLTPLIQKLIGLKEPYLQPFVPARLTLNLASQSGREEWVPVRLVQKRATFEAEPVFGKSNLIFTLVRADGLVHIPADPTGIAAGEVVNVYLSA